MIRQSGGYFLYEGQDLVHAFGTLIVYIYMYMICKYTQKCTENDFCNYPGGPMCVPCTNLNDVCTDLL